jgi:hypothetical protein
MSSWRRASNFSLNSSVSIAITINPKGPSSWPRLPGAPRLANCRPEIHEKARKGGLKGRRQKVAGKTTQQTNAKSPAARAGLLGLHCCKNLVKRGFLNIVLGRPGSDRLSHVLRRSTIGAGGFNGRVRNGIGWNSPAMTTRPAKNGSSDFVISQFNYRIMT